jgi:hypothetical protein
MKLFAIDNSDLMDISKITAEGRNLIVEGTIMGAMPIRAVLKPAELRRAIGMMSFGTLCKATLMLFRGYR